MKRERYKNGDPISLQSTGCNGCSPSMVNGLFIHEAGCPDEWRDREPKCRTCGCSFVPEIRHQAYCSDDCSPHT